MVIFLLIMVLIVALMMLILGRLAYSELTRPNEEEGLICATLDVVDSWANTHLAPAVNCDPSQSQSLFQRLNSEAEKLSTEMLDVVSQASAITTDMIMDKGNEMKEHVDAVYKGAYTAGEEVKDWSYG